MDSKPRDDDVVKTQLRMPTSLHDWVCDKARQDRRSMNNQIVQILEQAKAKEAA